MEMPHLTSEKDVADCVSAVHNYMRTTPLLGFPAFHDPMNEKKVVCRSNRARTGLEHDGDRQLYVMLGIFLRVLCPRSDPRAARFYHAAKVALTCNSTLALYMAYLNLQDETEEKEGGDTFETVFAALLDDRPYKTIAEWLYEAFKPMILLCLETLSKKRKQESWPEAEAVVGRPSKRPRVDNGPEPGLQLRCSELPRSSFVSGFITTLKAACKLDHLLQFTGVMPCTNSESPTTYPPPQPTPPDAFARKTCASSSDNTAGRRGQMDSTVSRVAFDAPRQTSEGSSQNKRPAAGVSDGLRRTSESSKENESIETARSENGGTLDGPTVLQQTRLATAHNCWTATTQRKGDIITRIRITTMMSDIIARDI
ncbi:hypothetical protein DFH06DRAFT_1177408, partial [Mycena polygramma]